MECGLVKQLMVEENFGWLGPSFICHSSIEPYVHTLVTKFALEFSLI